MGAKIIRIAARSSTLSQIQAQEVGRRMRAVDPALDVQFIFKKTQGDLDRITALASFGGKGVFTEDLSRMLVAQEVDAVVHSWKDLPVEMASGTRIGATLARADMRDVLLVRKEVAAQLATLESLAVLTSSPRREHNLGAFLPSVLPNFKGRLTFVGVRGNVPTRIRKLMENEGGGLVVAKAALDRMLEAHGEGFDESREYIRSVLSRCRFMVLPLRENPCAPAQGALAIEVARGRDDLLPVLTALNSEDTIECCERERQTLASYGGGCHQKIGVAVLKRPYGRVTFIQGETPQGVDLSKAVLEPSGSRPPPADESSIWPTCFETAAEREPLNPPQPPATKALWVVRDEALPRNWSVSDEQVVWCSGRQTWKKLAERGVWVNGSSEGLGETEDPALTTLCGKTLEWVKLTHEEGNEFPWGKTLVTYRKHFAAPPSEIAAKSHFFWRSGSEFVRALRAFPGIRAGYHASGPGSTALVLQKHLQDRAHLSVFLDYNDWIKEVRHS